jgi:hypothetical protein
MEDVSAKKVISKILKKTVIYVLRIALNAPISKIASNVLLLNLWFWKMVSASVR